MLSLQNFLQELTRFFWLAVDELDKELESFAVKPGDDCLVVVRLGAVVALTFADLLAVARFLFFAAYGQLDSATFSVFIAIADSVVYQFSNQPRVSDILVMSLSGVHFRLAGKRKQVLLNDTASDCLLQACRGLY